MAKILPFKAVRPTRDKVSLIASRSYQTYTKAERKARLDNNPYSFLHIINPGYKYHKEVSGKKRFQLVRNRYQEFKENGYFIQENLPSYYIYRIIDSENRVFTGIIAAASVTDYKEQVIKKHEDTLTLREELFKEYLKVVGFNSESVLLTYKDDKTLSAIYEIVMQERSEYEFTTTYRDTHYLWPVNAENLVKEIKNRFNEIDAIYIADGHHRCSSSSLLTAEMQLNKTKSADSYNYFMAYLIPESNLQISSYSRMVKDLNGLGKEEFLIALDSCFKIENKKDQYFEPRKQHAICMYLDGDFYEITLRAKYRKFANSLEALDAQILYKFILQPILGIQDLRNDKRIAYGKGKTDMVAVKEKIDQKKYAVGFSLKPVSIDEIKAVADENLRMPPKTTYIEPKLRSAVTIYEF